MIKHIYNFFFLFLFSLSHMIHAATVDRTAVVAGGAGFIGSHMCEALLEEGYHVICIDNLSTGNIKNIQHLFEKECFKFIEHDVTEELAIHEKIDEIYNFACPASPEHYQKDPIKNI